jgi:aminomethyltransferase
VLSPAGERVGTVTSGGFGPTVNGPVAMGYVAIAFAETGTAVSLLVRDRPLAAAVVPLPFVPTRYKR